MNTPSIVQKLWNYCNVLRDDGMSYGDYVEQLTYLLFLKMADEPVCVRTRTGRRAGKQPEEPGAFDVQLAALIPSLSQREREVCVWR